MPLRKTLLGLAYRRASAASAGLREFENTSRIQDFGSVRTFGHDAFVRFAQQRGAPRGPSAVVSSERLRNCISLGISNRVVHLVSLRQPGAP